MNNYLYFSDHICRTQEQKERNYVKCRATNKLLLKAIEIDAMNGSVSKYANNDSILMSRLQRIARDNDFQWYINEAINLGVIEQRKNYYASDFYKIYTALFRYDVLIKEFKHTKNK